MASIMPRLWDATGDFFTTYQTEKIVRLKSKWFRVPEILLNVVLFLVLIVWKLGYQLQFLETGPVEAASVVGLRTPQKNWNECHDRDIDCDDTDDNFLVPKGNYCRPEYTSGLSKTLAHRFVNASNRSSGALPLRVSCRYFDSHSVMPIQFGSSNLVTTVQMTMDQVKCAKHERCLWKNTAIRTEFVANIEDFLLHIRHSFTDAFGTSFGIADAQAFVEMHNGTVRTVLCPDGYKCPFTTSYYASNFDACGSDSPNRSGCFTTGWADYISIGTVLRAANVSLDEVVGGGLPLRFVGTSILLDVEYTNKDVNEFWWPTSGEFFHWWPTLRPKYTYRFKKLPMDYIASSQEFYEVPRYYKSRRRLVRRNGLVIFVRFRGDLARFNPTRALLILLLMPVIIQGVKVFVDKFLVRLYSYFSPFFDTRHVSMMAEIWKYEESPDDTQVRTADSGVDLHELAISINRRRADHAFGGNSPGSKAPE